jgi:hypothetical protein
MLLLGVLSAFMINLVEKDGPIAVMLKLTAWSLPFGSLS